jgi:uncharacterized protein DUF6289
MRGIRKLLSTRAILLAVGLVVAAGVYVASIPKAEAIVFVGPGVCTYYSDAKFRHVVGARGTGCCGSVINWGVTTQYKRCETLYCTDQICPN